MPLVQTTVALTFCRRFAIAETAATVDFAAAALKPPNRIVERGSLILPQSAADGTGHDVPITGLSGIARLSDEDIAPCPEPLQWRIATRRMRQCFPDAGRCLLVAEKDTPAIRAISLADGSPLVLEREAAGMPLLVVARANALSFASAELMLYRLAQ